MEREEGTEGSEVMDIGDAAIVAARRRTDQGSCVDRRELKIFLTPLYPRKSLEMKRIRFGLFIAGIDRWVIILLRRCIT